MAISPNDLKNPHKAARAAMWLFGEAYGRQSLGINDYYDKLASAQKDMCRRLVKEIAKAPPEPGK